MIQLRLPTIDHMEPSQEFLEKAVTFIKEHHEKGDSIYVHCRVGHGRSATIVLGWLLSEKNMTVLEAQKYLQTFRTVRHNLWKRPNINSFYSSLIQQRKQS